MMAYLLGRRASGLRSHAERGNADGTLCVPVKHEEQENERQLTSGRRESGLRSHAERGNEERDDGFLSFPRSLVSRFHALSSLVPTLSRLSFPRFLVSRSHAPRGNADGTLCVPVKHEEKAGVSEYWIVDTKTRSVNVFILDKKNEYALSGEFTGEENTESSVLSGLKVSVSSLFMKMP